MTATCQNCNHALHGKYCSNCGQPANTHRINLHFLWHDIQHGLLHMDKGILFTTKELFTRPGHSIREFIEGKRVKHFKPISLVLVLAGMYGFLSHYFEINLFANNIVADGNGTDVKANEVKELLEKMTEWVSQHYAVSAILQIPIYTLATYICFKKAGYNFMEHFVINTFIMGQKLILHILTFPLYCMSNGTPLLKNIQSILDLVGYTLFVWAIFQLFNRLSVAQRIWRIVASLLISSLLLLMGLIGILEWMTSSVK